ncbi:hypothetical protein MtrunA17_Chr7g0236061 [Medicago truncatula]|uniref:Transmembrane protein n=1 Tax=Medicago truncatula TaxID=3880 RepID=A0A396H064_MEDTR|nr:hypothetical protein MtrunA17_Chr7g0236061 [Medicago truncatula]
MGLMLDAEPVTLYCIFVWNTSIFVMMLIMCSLLCHICLIYLSALMFTHFICQACFIVSETFNLLMFLV